MIVFTGERVKIQVSTLFFLFSWSCVLFHGITSQKSCALFRFENYTIPTVEVTENSAIIIMFYLKNNTCINMENTVITIRRLDLTSNSYTPQCDIVLKNDTCRNTTSEHIYCGCLNTFGAYKFAKMISKSDMTQWKWTTKDGLADDVYVWFNEASTDRKFTSVTSTDGRTVAFPVTRIIFSITTEVVPVTTGLSSEGHLVDEGISLVVTVALPVALIIIFVSIAIIIRVKKTGQGKVETHRSYAEILRLNDIYITSGVYIEMQRDALPDVGSFQDRQQGRIISFFRKYRKCLRILDTPSPSPDDADYLQSI